MKKIGPELMQLIHRAELMGCRVEIFRGKPYHPQFPARPLKYALVGPAGTVYAHTLGDLDEIIRRFLRTWERRNCKKKSATPGLSIEGGGPGDTNEGPDGLVFHPATPECLNVLAPATRDSPRKQFDAPSVAAAPQNRQQRARRGA